MAKNNGLHAAKVAKDDEYYTMYEDVEKELINYEDQLKGKVIYCNCDDVRESNFLEYICRQAPHIGIRKVIGSHYNADGSPSYYVTFVPPPNLDHWDGDRWRDYLIDMPMEGNGDFRSAESIRLLQQADIIISNPPFSLFREYIKQLIDYNKKFLVIGNKNAISYKEIFPLIKDNKLWFGYNKPAEFRRPDGSTKSMTGLCWWFTNLETTKRNQPQELFLSYERRDREYPKYDNYDAIEVSKAIEIPKDYYGVMGVPITWLDKYCPTQFEIIGGFQEDICSCRIDKNYRQLGYKFVKQDGITPSTAGALKDKTSPKIPGKGSADYSIAPDGTFLNAVYARIFIRRRQQE